MQEQRILAAGANGSLGGKIIHYLIKRGAIVRAIIRDDASGESAARLRATGAEVFTVNYSDPASLERACTDIDCVVSALSGLKEVIIDAQTALLNAAVQQQVPRFIPSDYCIDYAKLPEGKNRNLDLRRAFSGIIDAAPIKATSILNGMFMDLLTGDAPLILKKPQKVIYWGDDEQLLDFTSRENTAEFTAAAALDRNTPRTLKIAGQVASIRQLQDAAIAAYGLRFKRLRVGGLAGLRAMIAIAKTLAPSKHEVFPPWQGMQYLHDMFTGLSKLDHLDNNRYAGIRWTQIVEMLRSARATNPAH